MLKNVLRKLLINPAKYLFDPEFRELSRISGKPRYTTLKTNILGHELTLTDGASFVFTYHEIFRKCIYNFSARSNAPYIIDCGANIGLSIIYFKRLYPQAKILAFEPDPLIFAALDSNVNSFKLDNVKLMNYGVWNEETTLHFTSEGADGGRISSLSDNKPGNSFIKTLRLRNFLENEKVDFLKIDIEGAETTVLKDCAGMLINVDHLFIEYHSFEGKEQSLHELLAVLHKAGFRVHALPVGHSPQPFKEIHSYMGIDLQFNIFAFRTKQ